MVGGRERAALEPRTRSRPTRVKPPPIKIYDFDGWDLAKELCYATGEGSEGDQQFLRGNRPSEPDTVVRRFGSLAC